MIRLQLTMNMRLEGIEKAERNVRTEDGGITVATVRSVESFKRCNQIEETVASV